MVSYDGKAITYDAIGNPLTYDGWTYTWAAGRQLKQMTDGTTTLQFKYNDTGLRTQKINGTFVTKYYWSGSKISHITKGSKEMHFWYDAAGLPTMMTYDDTKYYYKLNQQGDVIGLMSAWSTPVVTYTYDSWGKTLSRTGTLADTLGIDNPLRYRGYIVDNETGLYYLQSRYYNPVWGRFINADELSALSRNQSETLSKNLFCYCNNNPINRVDATGHDWLDSLGKVLLFTGVAIVGIALIAATAGAATPLVAAGGAAAIAAVAVSAEAVGAGLGLVAGGTYLLIKSNSNQRRGIRDSSNGRKEAQQKAQQKSREGYEPRLDPPKNGLRPHYHPGCPDGDPIAHDHYFFPKRMF